ncbi:NAD(P)H-hydrate dehydratase [Arenimonas composti]|uniref:ADP-dependent (S)-NAD(P)H-hydrate dehydratase n=1 Tax=Arenimonas composti TR7-09 = DSM 18010 TaxID=1121013 RepID=A0A091BHI5_9GAMM|nr:NAD(P)H-hydrate dehydratase [Arenimonas composti]KFN51221.1 hypothetical protein P873_02865 [Arenimonas composti TR7-09 = DSM 18010]
MSATVTPVDAALLRAWALPLPEADADKEVRGRVLVVAGARDVPGAARLAGEAALRAGAGKLQVATAAGAGVMLGLLLPEARVLELPVDRAGAPRASTAAALAAAGAADALLIGPGLPGGAATAQLVRTFARRAGGAVVLDAGALVAAGHVAPAGPLVLTPHAGELAKLMQRPVEAIAADPVAAACECARDNVAVVVLKGATTVIASPDGDVFVHQADIPGLATSGSGDVLAGLVAGLLARGAPAVQAAVWAVALHAGAGRVLARRGGPLGALAREFAGEVPALLRNGAGLFDRAAAADG